MPPRVRQTKAGRTTLDDGRIEGLFLYEVQTSPARVRLSTIETFTCPSCWLIKPVTQRSADGEHCNDCHADA